MTDTALTPADAVELLGKYGQGLPQVSCNVIHMFAPGIYIRQVHMPAGSLIVGHRHKTTHLNILLQGRLTLIQDDGSSVMLRAPVIAIAPPGRKTAFIHEDSMWLNLHATDETDVEELEREYLDVHESFIEMQEGFARDCSAEREDFEQFLWEQNLSAQQFRESAENTDDQVPFPLGPYKFKVASSPIQGKGLIATCDIEAGEMIAPARINGRRTPAGRYTNHSPHPNAAMREFQGDLFLVALKDIPGCVGGLDGDEITVDYRDAMKLNRQIGQIQ